MTQKTSALALLVLATLTGFAIIGCEVKAIKGLHPEANPSSLPDKTYQTFDDLKPDALPGQSANLIMQGTEVPVTLSQTKKGEMIALKLVTNGVVVAEENYRAAPGIFEFVGASGESYVPPITLAKFPQKNRDTWEWKGEIKLGERSYPAAASITASPDELNTSGGHFEALLTQIDLRIEGEAKEPSRRTLKFWMAPGKGVIKRELGSNATREPRAEPATSQ